MIQYMKPTKERNYVDKIITCDICKAEILRKMYPVDPENKVSAELAENSPERLAFMMDNIPKNERKLRKNNPTIGLYYKLDCNKTARHDTICEECFKNLNIKFFMWEIQQGGLLISSSGDICYKKKFVEESKVPGGWHFAFRD